jgi:hypothetical protein
MKGLDCQFAVVMSELGQKRRFDCALTTSGLASTTDISLHCAN